MPLRKIGFSFISVGILIVFVMLIADFVGLGSGGIQAAQLLGIEMGVVLATGGYILVLQSAKQEDVNPQWGKQAASLLSSPLTAILVGILTAYMLFSIMPMFFNADLRFQYFNHYLPDKYPIGLDLQTLLNRIDTWFAVHTPYPGDIPQFYPPLTYAFFAPLTIVEYRTAYAIVTLVTLVSYVLLTLLLPLWLTPQGRRSVVFFLFAISLFSYGLQFELERGQYNVLTFLFCLLAIYIYHFQHRFRYIAYLLFSLAVQLKVFPAIFILMFVKDWRDWKGTLRRFLAIGLLNIALLFILGYRVFLDFVRAISQQVVSPSWLWNGNHAIQGFVFNLMKDGYGLFPPETLPALRPYSGLLINGLLAIFAICLILVLVFAYRRNESELNPYLFLVCTIGALIVPTSNDYTLSFFASAMAVFFAAVAVENLKANYYVSILIAITAFAYGSTLFPFKYKPYFLNNNFPALFVILISVTILCCLRRPTPEIAASGA